MTTEAGEAAITPTLQRLRNARVVAVIRSASAVDALDVSRAVIAGGLTAIEITFTTPDAGHVLRNLADEYGDQIALGAGTIVREDQATEAAHSGATFLVSPGFDLALVRAMESTGLTAIPGVLTPSDVLSVARAGLEASKLFPGSLGGPRYLESLRAPFPAIQFMPTGGVSPENIAAWFSAGAFAVGVGGGLAPPRFESDDDRSAVIQLARKYLKSAQRPERAPRIAQS